MTRRLSEELGPDVAEPQTDSIGAASGTAKCHHCETRIRLDEEDKWIHEDTGEAECQ